MKEKVRRILQEAASLWAPLPPFDLERPKVKTHGELATNLAMILAKKVGLKPQAIAQQIIEHLKEKDPEGLIASVQMAGAGFLNFTLDRKAWQESLRDIIRQDRTWGHSGSAKGQRAVVEFVSANPTGPLHIGNARGGPLGDVIASLLQATGCDVVREFYVNDVGGQIDKLGQSLLYWIQNAGKENIPPPEGYQGEYVRELAESAQKEFGEKLKGREEQDLIHVLGRFGIRFLLNEIKRDCRDMGIQFDSWVHEKAILGTETAPVIEELKKRGFAVAKDGAVWFAPKGTDQVNTEEGRKSLEDRESVLERSDGRPTYFANDIAYHVRKYQQGYDRLINIWGSNHHGHVPRVQGALKSLGLDPNRLETVLYQYVRVKRGSEAVKMSKRGGNFVTAREVLDEVGKDALRFFLLMRAPDSHLDFDLELATKQSQENPVYYLQYAHARLCSIERKAAGIAYPPPDLSLLNLPEEIELIRMINEYPEEIARSAEELAPHRVTFYLLELAKVFQSYYSKAKEDPAYRVLSPRVDLSGAKMYLCRALKLTISQGLRLLGISAPDVMVQDEKTE